jgi:dTMP kinase
MAIKRSRAPGRLIAVEGLDGSGKSTQVSLLKRWLELEGCKVFFTEWNSSTVVKEITKKGKRRKMLTPMTFSLLHSADFADRYERQILPLLHAGYIVLADRYIYTAFARDGVRGCDRRWLRDLYRFAKAPDITFYFKVPLEVALNRILSGRPSLKYYEAGMDLGLAPEPVESFRRFQGLILSEYTKLTSEFSFQVIDASAPPEQQQEIMRRSVMNMIDLDPYRILSAQEASHG